MIIESMLKVVLFIAVIGIVPIVYRNREFYSKQIKPLTIRDIYNSTGFVREGIILESKNDDTAKMKHLKTLDDLLAKTTPDSLESAILKELKADLLTGVCKTQFEKTADFHQQEMEKLTNKITELKDKNQHQRDRLYELKKENRKLSSYLKYRRRS